MLFIRQQTRFSFQLTTVVQRIYVSPDFIRNQTLYVQLCCIRTFFPSPEPHAACPGRQTPCFMSDESGPARPLPLALLARLWRLLWKLLSAVAAAAMSVRFWMVSATAGAAGLGAAVLAATRFVGMGRRAGILDVLVRVVDHVGNVVLRTTTVNLQFNVKSVNLLNRRSTVLIVVQYYFFFCKFLVAYCEHAT